MKKRIFVRKINDYSSFAVYDIFGLDDAAFERVKYSVFAEVNQDVILDQIDLDEYYVLEYLPGQFDIRADSAMQCLRMLGYEAVVSCGYGHTGPVRFNAVEMRLKDMSRLELPTYSPNQTLPPPVPITPDLRERMGLAMSEADLDHVATYFQGRGRAPSETEVRVIDTYWSDHCRHTTFETILEDVEFTGPNAQHVRHEWDAYLRERQEHRPITLMDLATLAARREDIANLEVSSEINACSVYATVNGERYIIQFKNETHNHPTEIEPFGGASTCIGGAIRDPLSGRAFVYQAMRISGSHDPINDVEIAGKLSSAEITTTAAAGYSSYGNQIGLATTLVDEFYHPGYRAKRLELGFVLGAVRADQVLRADPTPGDIVLLIGGATGRDGIGGATGSSKSHTRTSTDTCGAEVQKGNAPMERKIQRLFRNPEVTRRIKKCNDFGAGGVCVAIGELAPGIDINLDAVPVKYQGLTGTEIAISESQERMAVVVDPADVEFLRAACADEVLACTPVAEITATPNLVMRYLGEKIVDIERSFLDTNGVRQRTRVRCQTEAPADLRRTPPGANAREQFLNNLRDLNVCSKRGLNQLFDSTIGATTALLPFGGTYQATPSQVSAQLVATPDSKDADVASVAAPGFNVNLASQNPFQSGQVAVVESMARACAAGVNYRDLYFTFQEYFPKLGADPARWGVVVQTLLGANQVLRHFHLAAIGGKDSMSGTYEDLEVPPTLVSFAVGLTPARALRSGELKRTDTFLTLLDCPATASGLVDLDVFEANLNALGDLEPLAVWAIGPGGVAEAVAKMALGNRIAFDIDTDIDLYAARPGAFLVETATDLVAPTPAAGEDRVGGADTDPGPRPGAVAPTWVRVGRTCPGEICSVGGASLDLDEVGRAFEEPLAPIFDVATNPCVTVPPAPAALRQPSPYRGEPHTPLVLLPVFAGTNCEYDMSRAFNLAGAEVEVMVYHSGEQFAAALDRCDILGLSGGFSAGDEPDGSAKFIAAVLRQEVVRAALDRLVKRQGLILGICNGFQALIKSGLLPYGRVRDLDVDSPTLARNASGHHIARMVKTAISSTHSPWLHGFTLGQVHPIPISHGEGRVRMSQEVFHALHQAGQIATSYVGDNPNGSDFAIEGLLDPTGQILGKMGHSERFGADLYRNYPPAQGGEAVQDIFSNAVRYFQCR